MEEQLQKLYVSLCQKIDAVREDIKKDVKGELSELKRMYMDTQEKCSALELVINKQQEEILHLKKELNKQNIIIHGIQESENEKTELENKTISILNDKMKLNLTPSDVHQIYRLGKSGSNKPIKLCLMNMKLKQEIFNKRSELRGTNIYINEDLPRELRIRASEHRKQKPAERKNEKKRRMLHSSDDDNLNTPKTIQEAKKKADNVSKNYKEV